MVKNSTPIDDHEYAEILQQAVAEINMARTIIEKQVNILYEKQVEDGYGSGVVKRLSLDLKRRFPDMGVSPRNFWDMNACMSVIVNQIQKCYKL